MNLPAAAARADTDEPELRPRIVRWLQTAAGVALIVIGLPLALLPLHLGLPLVLLGLVLVLRSSTAARRKFVEQQRKRPRLLFPIRRLLRRDPEVFPVAWQQLLRLERMIIPARWRIARTLRRRLRRRGAPTRP